MGGLAGALAGFAGGIQGFQQGKERQRERTIEDDELDRVQEKFNKEMQILGLQSGLLELEVGARPEEIAAKREKLAAEAKEARTRMENDTATLKERKRSNLAKEATAEVNAETARLESENRQRLLELQSLGSAGSKRNTDIRKDQLREARSEMENAIESDFKGDALQPFVDAFREAKTALRVAQDEETGPGDLVEEPIVEATPKIEPFGKLPAIPGTVGELIQEARQDVTSLVKGSGELIKKIAPAINRFKIPSLGFGQGPLPGQGLVPISPQFVLDALEGLEKLPRAFSNFFGTPEEFKQQSSTLRPLTDARKREERMLGSTGRR